MEVSKYNQMMAYLTRPKRGLVDGPGSYSGNPYANSPKFKKFLKEYGDYYRIADVVRAYERKLSTEGKVVGIKKLYEALGPDNPYTFETFNNIFSRADRKITKNMSNVEKNYIKAGQRLKKIIIDNIGEPELLGDLQKKFKGINIRTKGTSTNRVFTLNKTKIKNLNKALNKNYNSIGFREKTIDNVFELVNDKDFMKSLKAYKGGRIDETSPLFKKLFQAGKPADMPYAYMTLGRALRGEIAMEGIKKNKALGNKIIKSISGDFEGPLGTAAKRWAKLQMAKHFDDPNASYSSVTQTIKNAFKNAGVENIDIDEIFPARTGQITIGKGSGAYNQIVQFIDSSINTGAKRAFDGRASKRYQLIIDAYKNKNFDKVKQLVDGHQTDINNFYKRNPEAKGKVKLTQLNYNPKTRKFASPTAIYGKDVLPPKILSDMDKFYRKTGLSLDVGSTMTLEKAAKDESLKKIIAALGCPGKAKGGRIGFQEGTVPSTQCVRAGAKIVNEGKFDKLSPSQQKNLTSFLNRAAPIGRAVMKFGVIPEAIWVAGASLYDMGRGAGLSEALLRGSDYLLPGNQGKMADRLKFESTMGKENAETILRAKDYKKSLEQLATAKSNLETNQAVLDESDFSYTGNVNAQNQLEVDKQFIKAAEQNVKNKYQRESVLDQAVRSEMEAEDIRGTRDPFYKAMVNARSAETDDFETLFTPEKKQKGVAPPMLTLDDIALANVPDAFLESERAKIGDAPELTKRNVLDFYRTIEADDGSRPVNEIIFRELFRNARGSSANQERFFGTQGIFARPVIDDFNIRPPRSYIQSPFQREEENRLIEEGARFGAAGGGIMKLAGVDSGPPPEKGPTPQGLDFLLKRGR